jgi:hypothetical protein
MAKLIVVRTKSNHCSNKHSTNDPLRMKLVDTRGRPVDIDEESSSLHVTHCLDATFLHFGMPPLCVESHDHRSCIAWTAYVDLDAYVAFGHT